MPLRIPWILCINRKGRVAIIPKFYLSFLGVLCVLAVNFLFFINRQDAKYAKRRRLRVEDVWWLLGSVLAVNFLFFINRQDAKYAKRRRLRVEDDAFDALFEDGDVKVDQEAEGMFGGF